LVLASAKAVKYGTCEVKLTKQQVISKQLLRRQPGDTCHRQQTCITMFTSAKTITAKPLLLLLLLVVVITSALVGIA
jgi:hypothetical protein